VEPIQIDALIEKRIAETLDPTLGRVNDTLDKLQRTPSKAHLIGSPGGYGFDASAYEPGAFLGGITGIHDPQRHQAAKAALDELGSAWSDVPDWSKSTLGTTDAAGGWIVPNALVDSLIKPKVAANRFRELCTVVSGINAASVDVPFRSAAPDRAVIAAVGATKENANLAYNGYTVTMYTLARIYDLANQFVRKSRGAAEQDVLQELASAFAKGERYYTISGSGSSEPYGLVTALTNSPSTFTTSFSAATTLAGSVLSAISTAAGDLAGRDVQPTAALMNSVTYWQMFRQGADAAGFYVAGTQGNNLPNVAAGTLVTPFGIPVYHDSLVPTDDLIVGDFKALKLYFGDAFRVDSSSEAGTRWDTNLTGFRGEEEMGFDARPAVFAGNFQYVADIVP
jgi:HK97 family phage major capsid protein